MENMVGILHLILALIFAPLLVGIINRTKACFAGRRGPPCLQLYYDLFKLLHKGAVYSRTTTWIFTFSPILALGASFMCLLVLPLGGLPSLFSFQGDLIVLIYLLALSRFFTVLAAMDTGNAFEGMGASREMTFAALAEPAFFFGLAAIARSAGSFSLNDLIHHINLDLWQMHTQTFTLVLVGIFLVFLAENARIPVDDPNTHLELTMIHEVMILDHSGVDLGLVEYAASLKLWILGCIIVGLAIPIRTDSWAIDLGASFLGMLLLAIVVGIIESIIARIRMNRIPHLLVGACAFSIVGFLIH